MVDFEIELLGRKSFFTGRGSCSDLGSSVGVHSWVSFASIVSIVSRESAATSVLISWWDNLVTNALGDALQGSGSLGETFHARVSFASLVVA